MMDDFRTSRDSNGRAQGWRTPALPTEFKLLLCDGLIPINLIYEPRTSTEMRARHTHPRRRTRRSHSDAVLVEHFAASCFVSKTHWRRTLATQRLDRLLTLTSAGRHLFECNRDRDWSLSRAIQEAHDLKMSCSHERAAVLLSTGARWTELEGLASKSQR